MRKYYRANKPKFIRTPEQQERYNASRRERYAADPEFRDKIKRQARNCCPVRKRDGRLRATFGISVEDYEQMLIEQDGKCAICRAECGDSRGHRLHVDHCHATGLVRGLLCSACNQGLGKYRDDPDRLRRAAEYIERSRLVGDLV